MGQNKQTHEIVKQYYGDILQNTADLKTDACCSMEAVPAYLKNILAEIHPEVLERFYGCGSPIPPLLDGCTVLDLGCGTGRDAYVLSKLVGAQGRVIGVDMTQAQLDVAHRHIDFHRERFGHAQANTRFLHGTIEDLQSLNIQDNSIDVVISNCVLNLSPQKSRVFGEIFRVLRPGGELYFSDVFADRRIPDSLAHDPVLRGECLGGALYCEDFRRMLAALHCHDYRTVSQRPLALQHAEIAEKVGDIRFYSATVRSFKLPLEDRCEDYGQTATYRGTIPESLEHFALDEHHRFPKGEAVSVCGNTACMLSDTRYGPHFEIHGDRSIHRGPFACTTTSCC
jgi:arsenite methyltransferase